MQQRQLQQIEGDVQPEQRLPHAAVRVVQEEHQVLPLPAHPRREDQRDQRGRAQAGEADARAQGRAPDPDRAQRPTGARAQRDQHVAGRDQEGDQQAAGEQPGLVLDAREVHALAFSIRAGDVTLRRNVSHRAAKRRMQRVGVNRNEDDLLFRDTLFQRTPEDRVREIPAQMDADDDVIELELRRREHELFVARHRDACGALLLEDFLETLHDVVDIARLGDAIARRSRIGAAMAGVEDHVDAGEIASVRAFSELRTLPFGHLGRQSLRIVGGQVLRQQQRHRDFYRVADRNLRDVVDPVEVHDAIDDVADILRVDPAGEADGHRGIEGLPFLQPVDGVRFGRVALIAQRRLPCGNSFHCHIRIRRIRWRMLNRIVLRFPNLRSLRRYIQSLPLATESRGE